jgi:choline dehydrogenase-like flavoprotein
LYRDIPSYARILSEASNGAIGVQAQEELLRIRAGLFFEKGVAIGALTFGIFGGNCWVTLPLSTGSVHVSFSSSTFPPLFPLGYLEKKTDGWQSSHDPSKPLINPNFMQLPWDTLVQTRLFSLLRSILSTPSITSTTNTSIELSPGYSLLPTNATLPQTTAVFQAILAPVWHAVGSAGMRKREWGGVVDEKFRVYGTQGLRVVDASVVPVEVNGNPTSVIYALAEKAAEDILGDCA